MVARRGIVEDVIPAFLDNTLTIPMCAKTGSNYEKFLVAFHAYLKATGQTPSKEQLYGRPYRSGS